MDTNRVEQVRIVVSQEELSAWIRGATELDLQGQRIKLVHAHHFDNELHMTVELVNEPKEWPF